VTWKTVKLGELFEFKNGRSFKKAEWSEAGLPIIRIQNLNNFNAGFNYFNGDYNEAIEVNLGDLLFSWSGTVGSSFGPHLWNREKGVLNQHIFKLTKKQNIDSRYAFYCLKNITQQIEQSVVGAVGIVHVTKKNLVDFEIPLPPPAEQERIVAKLDAAFTQVDAAIALTETKETEIEAAQNAVLSSEFNPQRTGKSSNQCPAVTWNTVKLGDVLKTGAGGTPLKSKKEYYEGGTVSWLLSGAVSEKEISASRTYITEAGLQNSSAKVFPPDTVLVAMYGATAGQVGILRISAATNQAVCGIYPDENYLPDFLYYYLQNYKERLLLETSGVAQPNLSQAKIRDVRIPVLSLEEQERIVAKLDAVFAEAESAQSAIRLTRANYGALKSAILAQELQGEAA